MSENITKIKVGDDVRCISLDTEVIDTQMFTLDSVGKLRVNTGSTIAVSSGGLEVKISSRSNGSLVPTSDGLLLDSSVLSDMIDTEFNPLYVDGYGQLKKNSIDAYGVRLCLGTFGRGKNFLVFRQTSGEDTGLVLGSGFDAGNSGNVLNLKLGSGLWFDGKESDGGIKVNVGDLLTFYSYDSQNSQLTIDKPALCAYLESVYNLTKK